MTKMVTRTIALIAFVLAFGILMILGPQVATSNAASTSPSFTDSFARTGTLAETGQPAESASPDWWLNSGAYLHFRNGYAETIQGELPADDFWRLRFFQANPAETDDGFHPQNIFRLIQRGTWHSFTQQAGFRINRYILSPDVHRQAGNGLLLLNRYVDGDDLYYCGLRVDGLVTIKKKYRGIYYIMASKKVLPGVWSRDTTPNLIPTGAWIGIRSTVSDTSDGRVRVELYLDQAGTGSWSKVLEAYDDGISYGGPSIDATANAGIRTDFMDVQFKDYSIQEALPTTTTAVPRWTRGSTPKVPRPAPRKPRSPRLVAASRR